jgi:hypothetical protein
MVMYCHSSLLDLCLQSLVREGGSSAPFYQSIAGLPNNLKVYSFYRVHCPTVLEWSSDETLIFTFSGRIE